MEIVLGADSLAPPAGSETYLVTVAEQLERTGHSVTIYARLLGERADRARGRGLRVADAEGELPGTCDAVLAQHTAAAYELAERYPGVPSLYVAHSAEFVSQQPPQAPGVAAAVVVMNDRVRRAVEVLGSVPEVIRLYQPIDLQRFGRTGAHRSRLTRLVLFGHDQGGRRLTTILACCERLGIEAELIGRHGRATQKPELELGAADAVVAIGRCAIEGMASRRAVYVSGVVGTDGWLTESNYEAIEGDGFSGRALPGDFSEGRFMADLAAWTPALGDAGRDLAYRHHDAADHAAELVRAWTRLANGRRPDPPTEAGELARLARAQAALESRAVEFGLEARSARNQYERMKAELLEAGEEINRLKATRRYKLAAGMARPLDAVRRWRDGRNGGGGSPPHD
jgi:hypothetical protein